VNGPAGGRCADDAPSPERRFRGPDPAGPRTAAALATVGSSPSEVACIQGNFGLARCPFS